MFIRTLILLLDATRRIFSLFISNVFAESLHLNVDDPAYHQTHKQSTKLSTNDTRLCCSPLNIYTRVFFFSQLHMWCDVSMTPCTNVKILVQIATVTVAVLGKHVGVIEDEFLFDERKVQIFINISTWKKQRNSSTDPRADTHWTCDPGEDTGGCRVSGLCLRLAAAARGVHTEQDPGLAQVLPPGSGVCRDEAWRQEEGQWYKQTVYYKINEPLKIRIQRMFEYLCIPDLLCLSVLCYVYYNTATFGLYSLQKFEIMNEYYE